MIGQLKSEIIKNLSCDYVEFGFWLYVPAQGVLLSFHHQICQGIEVFDGGMAQI